MRLEADEVVETIADINYDLRSLDNVLSWAQSHFNMAYRNLEPVEIPTMCKATAADILELRVKLIDTIVLLPKLQHTLQSRLEEEAEPDPDASPYDNMTRAEYEEEMFNQAVDYFYESGKDEALVNE